MVVYLFFWMVLVDFWILFVFFSGFVKVWMFECLFLIMKYCFEGIGFLWRWGIVDGFNCGKMFFDNLWSLCGIGLN